MADDIDIEEHDVLDNPQIKNIFPNLAQIKTEVFDEPDEFPYEDYADYNASVPIKTEPFTEEEYYLPVNNKIILGSKPTTHIPVSMETDIKKEYLKAYVPLKNFGPMLDNSPCYCKECKILFATVNTLDAHRMVAHSLLAVAPRPNRAIKSTAKSASDNGLLICNHCNKKFPDNASLITHLYIVMNQPKVEETSMNMVKIGTKIKMEGDGKRYFKCSVCTSYFHSESDLKCHASANHELELSSVITSLFDNNCAFCPYISKDILSYNFHQLSAHANISQGTIVAGKLVNYKCLICGHHCRNYKTCYKHKVKEHPKVVTTPISEKVFVDVKTYYVNTPFTNKVVTAKANKVKVKEEMPKVSYKSYAYKVKQVPLEHLFKCCICDLHFLSGSTARGHFTFCQRGIENKKIQRIWHCQKCQFNFREIDKNMHEFQHENSDSFKVLTVRNARMIENFMYKCGLCGVHVSPVVLHDHMDECDKVTRGATCHFCKLLIGASCYNGHRKKHHNRQFLNGVQVIKCIAYPVSTTVQGTAVKRSFKEEDESAVPIKKPKLPPKNANRVSLHYCNYCNCVSLRKAQHHIMGKCLKVAKRICKDCGLCVMMSNESHSKIHLNKTVTLKDIDLYDFSDNKIPIPMTDFYRCPDCGVHLRTKSHRCDTIQVKTCKVCQNEFEASCFPLHYAFHEVEIPQKEELPDLLEKYESLQAIWNILYQCEVCSTVTDCYDVSVEHSQAHFSNMESFGVILQSCNICELAFKGDCYQKHKELHKGTELTVDSFRILKFNYRDLHTEKWFKIFNDLDPDIQELILSKSKYKDNRTVKMKEIESGTNDETLYLCGCCKCVVRVEEINDHAFNGGCTIKDAKKCKVCNYSFTNDQTYKSHIKNDQCAIKSYRMLVFNLQEDRVILDAMPTIVSKQIKPKGVAKIDESKIGTYKYYTCVKCKLSMQYVVKHRCNNKKRRTCPHCKLTILRHSYPGHILRHKELYGKDASKLNVMKFIPGTATTKPIILTKKNRMKIASKKAKVSVLCSKINPKTRAVIKTKPLAKPVLIKTNNEDNKVEKITIKLFKRAKPKVEIDRCAHCDICFLSSKQVSYHFTNRKKKKKGRPCEQCGLKFQSNNILSKHVYLHHEQQKLTLDDIIIKDILRPHVNIRDKDQSDSNTDDDDQNDEVKETEIKEKPTDKITIFKCFECLNHLMSKDTHSHKDNRTYESQKCDVCELSFIEEDLVAHKKLHHEELKVERNKIVTKIMAVLYKCSECSIYSHKYENIDFHIKNHNRRAIKKMMTQNCDDCGYSFSNAQYRVHLELHNKEMTSSDFRIIDCNTEETSNDNTSDRDTSIIEAESPARATPTKYNVKLYKCGECNVCFLSQGVCYKHVLKHTKLDPREYVECKICGLQFSIMILHKHMKKHHIDDSCNLDQVLIEEYQVSTDGGAPKIEIYYAADRVQSELVSTTSEVVQDGPSSSSSNQT